MATGGQRDECTEISTVPKQRKDKHAILRLLDSSTRIGIQSTMSHHRPKNDDSRILHIEEEILRETRETRREVEEIERLLRPKRLTQSISVSFSGEITMNTLTLNVGQSSIGTITPLLADDVTPSGGAVSNPSFSIPPDPSFSAVDNSDGTVTITGLAVSAATVTGTASATVTDTDGAVSSFSQSFTVTVAAGTTPPVATTASIGVSFSTPVSV